MSSFYIIRSFVLFDSTYEWNHMVFVFLSLTGWGLFLCLPVCWFVFLLHAFFSSVMFVSWCFIIFSVSLLKVLFIRSSPVIAEHLYGILWALYQVGCFSISSRPFLWDLSYPSISSFCLTLWFCLYVLDKTSAFGSLEEVVLKGRSAEDEPWGLEYCPSHPLEPGAQRSSLVRSAGPRWR